MVGTMENRPDLGIPFVQEQGVVSALKILLADEFLLYTKLRNFQWNVTGPHFHSLHELFEEQYTELADIVDEVAERIRQYGDMAPGTMEEFKKLARLIEMPGEYPDWRTMVAAACADHETLVRNLRDDIEAIDEEANDVATEDLMTGILQQHMKMAWMLRMYLEENHS